MITSTRHFYLRVYTFQLVPHGGLGRRCLGAALVDLGDELPRKLFEQHRLHEARLEAIDNRIPDIVAANRDMVGTGGRVAGTRACKSAGGVLGVVCLHTPHFIGSDSKSALSGSMPGITPK
jgi:hypothetical protein